MMKMPEVYVTEQTHVSLAGADLPPAVAPHVYTRAEFGDIVGRWPEHDDLDRLNCSDAGRAGHLFCGVCGVHGTLRWASGSGRTSSRTAARPGDAGRARWPRTRVSGTVGNTGRKFDQNTVDKSRRAW